MIDKQDWSLTVTDRTLLRFHRTHHYNRQHSRIATWKTNRKWQSRDDLSTFRMFSEKMTLICNNYVAYKNRIAIKNWQQIWQIDK